MIRWKQAVDAFPDYGMTFTTRIFFDTRRHTAPRDGGSRKRNDLAPTLEAAFKAGGVHLVDVPIDYSENTRVLIEELRGSVEVEPA